MSAVSAQSLPLGASESAPAEYTDVPDNHWAAPAVARLTELGILTGYPDGSFQGQQTASRYELAVVAARLLEISEDFMTALAQEPEVQAELESAPSDTARLQIITNRLSELESALGESPSPTYVQSLEGRIAELESQLAAQQNSVQDDTQTDTQTTIEDVVPETQVETSEDAADDASPGITIQPTPETDTQTADDNDSLLELPVTLGEADQERYWFGVSTGFPLGATLHFGVHDIVSLMDLRLSTSLGLGGAVDLGLNGLVELPVQIAELPVSVYAGLGGTLTVGAEEGQSGVDTQALLGAEYRLGRNQPGGIYVEFGPIVEVIPELDSSFVTKVGFNYHFD